MSAMIMDNTTYIECMLLPFGSENYILPIVAVAELGSLNGVEYEFIQDKGFGSLLWRELLLPLVTPDLKPQSKITTLPKYAVINALYVDTNKPPYFAFIIENHPIRLKIKPEELTWIDRDRQRAALSTMTDAIDQIQSTEVVLLDLVEISKTVETTYQAKSPNKP
ncbi:MAG: hypothetical protein HYX61_05955 [Gammaproteobacteria bacterium]|jgi:hypothetical protein|nr:hypothetical protein [Gammaproteobacteria bacterium]